MELARNTSTSGFDPRVIDTDGLAKVGRLGWAAKGVVYAIMGVLAVPIAFGGGTETASRSGALGEIAEKSFGRVLLGVVAVGLGIYAAWRLITAFLPGENDATGVAHRLGYLGSAVLYGSLAFSSLSLVVADGVEPEALTHVAVDFDGHDVLLSGSVQLLRFST